MQKPNNCPWCNERPYTATFEDGLFTYVYCPNEKCRIQPSSKNFPNYKAAIEGWNSIPNFRKIMIDTMVNDETWKACFPGVEVWT